MTFTPDQLRALALSGLDAGQSRDEALLHLTRFSDAATAAMLLDGTLAGSQRDAHAAMLRRKLAEGRSAESLRASGERCLGLLGWREIAGVLPRPEVTLPLPRPTVTPKGGPGTELHALLAELGITPKYGCGCENVAANMDRQGPDWCERNADDIARRLRENAAKVGWVEKAKAAALAVATGVVFHLNPADPYGSLVREAIRRHKEKCC